MKRYYFEHFSNLIPILSGCMHIAVEDDLRDPFQNTKPCWQFKRYHLFVHGEVYQLPARDGEPQYVPAVNDPCNDDCACIDFRSVTNDKEECARLADQMAESWAEREREYQAKQDAEKRLEEITTEIKSTYANFRRISRELRANCDAIKGVAVIRELVKEKWQDTKDEIRRLKREAKRIAEHGLEY